MNKKVNYNIFGLAMIVILIWLDQWTKALAVTHLKNQEPFVIIKGVFELYYLENRGAAFGIFQGQKWAFVALTLLVIAGIAFLYNRMPMGKRFYALRFISIALIAGAIGNLIDRLANSFVIDFLYFELIDFPIFNVADCYVTVAAFFLIVLFLFYYKEEDLEFIPFFSKKEKEQKTEKPELIEKTETAEKIESTANVEKEEKE